MATKLTSDFCKNVAPPTAGNRIHRCSALRGFALRVTAAGHRAFVFNYTSPAGRERRLTIGELGPWSVAAARNRAAELRRLVDSGVDPMGEAEVYRRQWTLGDLWEFYRGNGLSKLSAASQRDQASSWRRHIEPTLGKHTKLGDIRRRDIQRLVEKVGATSGGVSANRCHSYLRRMLNVAKNEGQLTENVASEGIDRHAEVPRERYLSLEELGRLSTSINAELPRPTVVAIVVLLLTGARRGEVLSMRWSDLDLENGLWIKPASTTKRRRLHRVPLSQAVVDLLLRFRSVADPVGSFVFSSGGDAGHITDLKRAWSKLCSDAGLCDVRLHDLRHTYASMLVSKGHSLPTIGKLLGHTQVQTTSRYAHLYDDVLRSATDDVGANVKLGN